MKPVTKRRPKVRKTRRPLLQKLEDRMLLAGDWTNPCAAHDISGDGHVSPLDALLPINQLDRLGSVPLSAERPADSPYFDADANDQLSPRDALVVINSLAMIGEASAHNSGGGVDRFQFDLELANDSGPGGIANSDGVTNDATISGNISSPLGVNSVLAQVGNESAVEVPHQCGSFVFDPAFESDGSNDGAQVIRVTALNSHGQATEPFELTLDTTAPDLEIGIAPEDNTGLPGDHVTSRSVVALTGFSDAQSPVRIDGRDQQTVADTVGEFRLDGIDLVSGENAFQVTAVDVAGNETVVDVSVVRSPSEFEEDQFVGIFGSDSLPQDSDSTPIVDVNEPSLPLVAADDEVVQYVATLLNDDFATDLVTVSRSTDEVLLYFGDPSGELGEPLRLASGGATPNAVWAGDFIGDRRPDIAVGHDDGTLAFIEGVNDKTFRLRPELAIAGLGRIVDLTASDFDGDGDLDLVVSGGDRVTWLDNDDDPSTNSPIINGTFTPDLRGWSFGSAGAQDDGIEGEVRLGDGHVQLVENDSFLVSLQQTITIPESPQTITFDLLELELGQTQGHLPDAFEVSLLDGAGASLVPPIATHATSLLNVAPDGTMQMGVATTADGTRVTVDISGVTPGTEATLYFDLIGNESNVASAVAFSNVEIFPAAERLETFSAFSLPGPFGVTSGVGYSDVNGDERLDVVVEDAVAGPFHVFLGDANGGFVREDSNQRTAAEGEAVNLQIEIGDQVSQSLAQPGEIDRFTFAGVAGQQLFFDAQQTTGLQNWTLTAPDGTEVFREGLTDREAIVLAETGTFTLAVSGFLAANGPYQFQIHEVPETIPESIAIGDPLEATLGVPGQELHYEFSLTESRSLFFDVTSNEGLLSWTLTGPGMTTLFDAATIDQGVVAFADPGDYALRIDGELDTTGTFEFQIHDVTPGPPVPLAYEDGVFAEIETPGQTDHYSVDAASGDIVFVETRLGNSSDLAIKLVDPAGDTVFEGVFDDLPPITLTQSGQHVIEVTGIGDHTGHYELVAWSVPTAPTTVIDDGVPIIGAITIPTQTLDYEIVFDSGDEIVFDAIYGADSDLRYSLTAPSGLSVFHSVQDDQTLVVAESGTHTLTVLGESKSVGPFSFQVGQGSIAPPIPEAANLVVEQLIAPRRMTGNPAMLEVSWTIRNEGDVEIPAGTILTHHFHLSADSNLDSLEADPRIQASSNVLATPLEPGQSITLNEPLSLPKDIDADLFVLVNADAQNTVFEDQLEQSDNVAAAPVIVSPLARELSGEPILDVAIDDGAAFPIGSEVSLNGSAISAPGATNAVFMLDLSGSTRHITDLDANFDGQVNNDDDLNGDGRVGDLLDREIGLTLETIRRLGQSATDVRVAVAAWTAGNIAFPSGGEILDVGAGRFNQLFIDPSSISDVAELEVSLRSLSHRQQGLATHSGATLFRDFVIGPGNNYDQSLQTLLEVLDVAPEADQTQVYYFTDGLFFGNEDLPAMAETIDEVGSRGIQFRAIQAVGPSQVRAICDANAAPDWCLSVDSGSEFVEVVQEISDGIDAVAGSAADIVIGDSPDKLDDLVLPPVLVAGVTVNDVAVESFDDDGNFFTRVTIEPGENPFVIRAVDSLGNETEQSVTLIGTAGPGAEQFHEVTAMTHIDFDTASLNRSESVLRTSARVVNPSGNRLRGPVHVVINRVEPPSITLISDHELDSEGRPVITLSDEIPLGGLASFESSASFELEFANAQSQRFEVDYSILAAGNSEPSWASSPTTATAVGNEYRYDAVAFDPNGDDLVYSVTQGPNSLTVDPATGNVRWTPTSDQLGNHTVELSVHDGWGGVADQTFQLSVSETIANRPPLVQSSPRTQVSVGQAYVYQVEASDLDGDTLSYSLAASPAGLTVNASTGLLEWSTPSPGAHDVVIEVSDGASIASQAFVLTVGDSAANPTSPVVLSTPTIVAAVEQAYVYVPFAQDPDGDALQYSVITAPQGLTLDAASGRIDWLPLAEQVGNHTVAFKVEDGRGGVATQLFSVEVLDESTNLPPAFISLPAVLATAGETYHDAAIAVDPNSDPLDFQIVNGPAGMVIDEQSGQIEFTPSSDQLGLHRVTLRVSDGHAVGLQSFDLDVRIGPNERPEFESIPGSVATVGRTYFYAAVANDPNDEVRYQVIAGPAGFAIDPDSGLASMTPGATQLGSHSIVIGASDERGAVAQQSFLLEVVEDTEAPIVSVILSTSVAQPNEPVTVSVAAVDDVAIDSISLTIDGVEFSLDSVNTATFESPEGGLFDVIATATDLSGNVGTASTRLRVIDPSDVTPPQLTLDSPMPGQQIGYLTDIVGSVLADDLEFFRVDFAPADLIDADDIGQPNPAWVTLAESNVAGSAMALATFDPTVLNDGSYLIRVHAQDFSGNADVQAIPVEVVAPAKLGPFSVEYTDLTIPLAGLSLEVTRRYSTLDAQEQGDFGYGWKMGFDDPDIRETAPADETNSIGLFGATPFTFGTRVYLTNPDGERIGFSFEPERTASFFGDAYTPKFVADVGVEDRLEVDPITLSQSSDGSFQAFLIGFPYNPDQYRLVRPNGDVYEYDQRVGLEKVTDISGNELIISTDGITHSSGASIDFVRDPLGRISEIIDPAGHSISYQYDPLGRLSMVTDQEGTTTEYEYLSEPANYLSKTIGPDGQITQRTEYDDQGRIVATIDAEGHRVEQFWDPTNFSGTITDGNGNVTTLTYNERGNVLQEIDAANSVTLYEYGDQRHPDLETRIVDRRGFVTDRAYDDAGNLTRSSELGPMDAFWDQPLVSSFTYDANGYLTSQANPRGHQTRWEYDASGNVTAVVDANLNRQTSLYDERGRLIERSDFNQKVTSVSYSTNDQPTRIAFADGSHAEFQHNEFGQLALEQVFESDGTLVQQIQITYDRTGRVATQIVGIDGDDDHPATLTHRVYDAGLLDYVVFTNPESLDGDGVPIESPLTPVEERLSAIVDYEYDGNGRLIRETDPQGGVTEHRYDGNGNHILRQDPIGNITTWVYDSLNRVSEMRDPFFHLGMTISDALATLDVPSGADCDSNAVASHLTLSCYDAEGNLTKRIDRNERRIEFDHDHRGRVLEERWFDEADNVIRSASFEYDAIGNLISAADANSHYAFEYDSLNRLVSSDNNPNDSLAIPRTVLSYSHDPQGNVLQTSDQSGVLVESRYDQRDRLLSRDWSLSDLDTARIDFFYSAVGRETEAQRFDGDDQLVSRTLRTYDSVSRPDSVTHLDAADGLFAEYEYGYNFAGLVTSKELTRPDASQSESFDYRYDLNGQVVESLSGNGGTESFQYDANGNRVGIGNQVGENNQLLADSEYTYEYDAEGNLIGRTEIANGNVTVYEYDHRNRLITVQESSAEGVVLSETRYTYDVLNRRIAQTKNGETLHTVYNADNAWADFGDDGSVVTRYLFGERVDQVLARFEPNEGITWHLTDTQGSVRELVDAAGNPIFQISYDTFGIASTMSLESTGRYLYAGREYDQDVGLYYNRARFYDPLQGRFLSQDPLGFNAGDSNLYRYVGNSPANGTDPTGEATALEYAMKAVYAVALLNIACAAVDFAADLELDYEVDPAKIALQGGFAAGSGVVAFGFGPVGALVLGIVNASLNLYACATGDTV